jgi:transposase InsO family protein
VAFAIDLYSRAIVGWQASTTKDIAFVEACLKMALWRRDHAGRPVGAGMIHHSDAGSQAVHVDQVHRDVGAGGALALDRQCRRCVRQRLRRDRRGALQERGDRQGITVPSRPLKTLEDVEEITFSWVQWYNAERLHSYLGNILPEEFEANYYAESDVPSTDGAANITAA